MTEKRRSTTFRTSKGTTVNVAAPSVYISPTFLSTSPAEMREVLREELDVHSTFDYHKYVREGVDSHFIGLGGRLAGNVYEVQLVSEYWINDYSLPARGKVVCPSKWISWGFYSKRAFNYPALCFVAQLPDLTAFPDNSGTALGFENGWGTGTGIACFTYVKVGGVERLRALAGGEFIGHFNFVDITSLLPATYKTAPNYYSINVSKNLAEFYINEKLVAVAINSPNLNYALNVPGPPYALFFARQSFAPSLTSFIELRGYGKELTLYMGPYFFRMSDGDPRPPRLYRLYQTGTNTLLAGLSVNPDVTSHPFPLFGYDGKTINFMADEAGTLAIRVLKQTNTWRTYDSVAVVANTLLTYNLAAEEVLGRIVFTPTAPPANILEAEVVLR